MKVKEFIVTMKADGMNTAVFEDMYERFQQSLTECSTMAENDCFFVDTQSYKNLNECYQNLYGFLWGLYTVGYICDDFRKKLVDELISEFAF